MRPPFRVQLARALLLAIAALHLVIPAIMVHRYNDLLTEIASRHSELSAAAVQTATVAAERAALVFHGLLFILCLVLVAALARRKAWARRLAIVSQFLSALFGFVSWRSSTMFHSLIPFATLMQIGVAVLLLSRSTSWFYCPADDTPH